MRLREKDKIKKKKKKEKERKENESKRVWSDCVKECAFVSLKKIKTIDKATPPRHH